MANSENKELQAISESILAKISGGHSQEGINYGICPICGSTKFYPISADRAKEWILYRCMECGGTWSVDEEGIHINS